MDRLIRERFELGESLKNKSYNLNTVLTAQEDLIAHLFAGYFNKNFDAYDRAIDSVYNLTRVGGSGLHHLVDGQHTIFGALRAVKDVSEDDSFFKELSEATEHLFRDSMSVSGINPFISFTPDEFNKLAEIAKKFGISKTMLKDALTFNGPELVGGLLGITSLMFFSKTKDEERLSELSAAYLISSISALNPILFPFAAYKLINVVKDSDQKIQTLKSAGKGAIISGTSIAVSSLIGGPMWISCIASIGATVAVRYAIEKPDKAYEKIKTSGDLLKKYILKAKDINLEGDLKYEY
ncbi:hypothetical protein [Caloramator proteoclasticus]|uniref:Uncharacterized protein n=1 Tax=Caloramator proteoclasticus DSM 10124 TaxID=1121262 RepID=A0A1M4Z328_9CLOT|nr:hypothetical protein [Caloramator proteoclasticus]SHF12197.1 hypothetical protein SAMN02746091_01813 [Caloramator proteoclasticus DSM 10124]